MSACVLIGIGLFFLIVYAIVKCKHSQGDNQAASLNMRADEPVSKFDANSNARKTKERK